MEVAYYRVVAYPALRRLQRIKNPVPRKQLLLVLHLRFAVILDFKTTWSPLCRTHHQPALHAQTHYVGAQPQAVPTVPNPRTHFSMLGPTCPSAEGSAAIVYTSVL